MIIQALVKRYVDAGGCTKGWQKRPVDYVINIDLNGNVLDMTPLTQQAGKKKIRRTFELPEEPKGRTSGIKAAFLCDNRDYFFGLEPKRGKAKFEAAADLHNKVLHDSTSDAAEAIKKFFISPKQPDSTEPTGNYIFAVLGRYAHEDEDIRKAWNAYVENSADGKVIRCLVSGKHDQVAVLHGKIKLPGVKMSAAPLISINEESALSYGNTLDGPAARIGQSSSFAYVTALNDLLSDSKHNKRFEKDTLVYWAEGADENEAEVFSWLSEPEESDTSKIDALMRVIATGGRPNPEGCDISKTFYLLCLAPNAARISVRYFLKSSFGMVIENILSHYARLEITGIRQRQYITPKDILRETASEKSASGPAPLLGGQLLRTITIGGIYPMTLYIALLTRIHAGEKINRTKAAVIKAVLIKNYNSEVAAVALNKDSMNIPYTLGRLFYLLEYLQEQANGTSNIRQKYFSSACSSPRSVFPTLLSLSMHHADKLDNDAWFEKQKCELLSRLNANDSFPSTLNLQQQGEFIIGYYHQQQDRYTKKEGK